MQVSARVPRTERLAQLIDPSFFRSINQYYSCVRINDFLVLFRNNLDLLQTPPPPPPPPPPPSCSKFGKRPAFMKPEPAPKLTKEELEIAERNAAAAMAELIAEEDAGRQRSVVAAGRKKRGSAGK